MYYNDNGNIIWYTLCYDIRLDILFTRNDNIFKSTFRLWFAHFKTIIQFDFLIVFKYLKKEKKNGRIVVVLKKDKDKKKKNCLKHCVKMWNYRRIF